MRAFAIFCLLLSTGLAQAAPACAPPRPMHFEVSGVVRRAAAGFTEGLEVHDGALYESTGDVYGSSHVARIDPASGQQTVLFDGGHAFFGEGLTIWKDNIYQLTWREHRVFVYDLKGRRLRTLSNPREGWGLTHDSSRLIASDGSDRLYFVAPDSFATLGSVQVMDAKTSVSNLNELEYVDGAVYANVFMQWDILRIAPDTGCVLAMADLRNLRDHMSEADRKAVDFDENFVLNGIAYAPATGLFTLTGKYWPLLFTGRFVDGAP